jgi:hypothetical protein
MSVDPVTLGAKLALTALSYAMAPKIEGPRLKTLEVTVADYGTPYPEIDGYCRIDGCPIGWAEKLREKKVESKTKGGKFANYKYYGTWWTIAAGHEVDGIPRIWMDRHLVLDLTKKGPVSVLAGFFPGLGSDSPVKLTQGKNIRIYLGSETQEIDPRYEEWCEDRYGPDSATARRGTAGVIFEEVPLEKFGNRIPQISMAVVNDPDPAYLVDTITPDAGFGPYFSKDRVRALFQDGSTGYAIYDVPTLTKIIDADWGGVNDVAWQTDGSIWGIGGFPLAHEVTMFSADGVARATFDLAEFVDQIWCFNGKAYLRPYGALDSLIIVFDGLSTTTYDVAFAPGFYFEGPDGEAWAMGMVGTTIHFRNINAVSEWTVASPGGVTGYHSAFFNGDGNIFAIVNNTAMVIDAASMTVTATVAVSGTAERLWNAMREVMYGSSRFFGPSQEINADDATVVRTYTLTSWTAANQATQIYDPINHALWGVSDPAGATRTIRYLDRITVNGVTLADVVERKCLRRGIPADAFDVSELTQPVLGYWTIQGTGAEQIAPCLDIHDVDATQHNYGLYFRTRGDASDALIDSSEFHANEGQRFDLSMVPESRIPARVEFNYADNTADQQPNTASDSVPLDSVAAQNKKTFDLTTYVDTPDDAQPKVNRYLRRLWFERELGETTLDITYGRLEPGDVKTVEIDGEQRVVRFTELTRSGLLVKAKWVRDDPRVHDITAQAGPTFDGREEDAIFVPSPTKAQVMDIPFLNDEEADDRPLLHYGAGDYGTGNWPGAIIWEGTFSAGEYEQWNAVDSAAKAVWGYCLDALPEPSSPWVWDRASSIQVNVKGTLTSATEAEILADNSINQALIGAEGRWEIVNFTTATLLGDEIWEISGFLRGRRGTEWACGLHAVGDELWLAEDLNRDSYGLSSVGLTEEFKGQTLGRDPVGTPAIEIDLTGNSLKPYAPANLTAERDLVTGDWAITGRRRTRVGGDWVGGTPIPLSEASEAYDIVILDGAGEEVRELTVTIDGGGNFSATYSASNQTTDFGSAQEAINIVAYQLSDAVGRGFPAALLATATGDILPSTITAGAAVSAANAGVTPQNPGHDSGDTLLCVVVCYGGAITAACATTGWTAADGVTNPVTMNVSRMWIFQNECDSDSELDPVITVSGGSSSATVMAVVLRIPRRDTAANFVLGTVSANAANDTTIAFAQNSPSIDDGNAIIAIGAKNRNPISGSSPSNITGQTAGLDWTKLVAFKTPDGAGMTLSIDYAINDSGSAYTAGTGATVTATYTVSETSAGVYLEVPLL